MDQLGKLDFSCDFFYYCVNIKDRKCFSDQINRNPVDIIFARRDCICSTTKDLRSLNSAVNKLIKQSRVEKYFLTVCFYHVTSTLRVNARSVVV